MVVKRSAESRDLPFCCARGRVEQNYESNHLEAAGLSRAGDPNKWILRIRILNVNGFSEWFRTSVYDQTIACRYQGLKMSEDRDAEMKIGQCPRYTTHSVRSCHANLSHVW